MATTLQVPQLLGGTPLVSGRVPYVGAGGKLTDSALFTYVPTSYGLSLTDVFTDPASSSKNFQISSLTNTITTNNAQAFIGIAINKRVNQNGFALNGTIRGTDSYIYASGASGTVAGVYGHNTVIGNVGAGIVTSAYAYATATFQNSGGGTLSLGVAFYCPPQTNGTTIYAYQGEVAAASGRYNLYMNGSAQNYLAGATGIGVTSPASVLHLKAGSATANTAPLQFNTGALETTARAGAVEFLTDDLYFTITTGAARKKFVLDNGVALVSGRVPYATTNGRLVDSSAFTYNGTFLAVGSLRLGNTSTPTALLHLAAGTATVSTAPIKLTTGTALASAEDGAIEYHSSHLYFTIGSTRYQLDQQSGGGGSTAGSDLYLAANYI